MANSNVRKFIQTALAPAAIGPYSQAVLAGKTLYISGQIGFEPTTMEIVEGGVTNQTRQALSNMHHIVRAAGGEMSNIVKTTVLLQDINDFQAMNQVYATFFPGPNPPARAAYQVSALPKGAIVEIEAVAVI